MSKRAVCERCRSEVCTKRCTRCHRDLCWLCISIGVCPHTTGQHVPPQDNPQS